MSYYEIIDDSMLRCGECPMWDHRNGIFYWSDMLTGKIFSYNPKTGERKRCARVKTFRFYMNEWWICVRHSSGAALRNAKRGWLIYQNLRVRLCIRTMPACTRAVHLWYDILRSDCWHNYERGGCIPSIQTVLFP